MEDTSQKHKGVPDDVQIGDVAGAVEDQACGVGETARKQKSDAIDADGKIIGIDRRGNGPTGNNVEGEAEFEESPDVDGVQHKANHTAATHKGKQKVSDRTCHGGQTRGGVGAENEKINQGVIAFLGEIAEAARLVGTPDGAGCVEGARGGVQGDERHTEDDGGKKPCRSGGFSDHKDQRDDAEDRACTVGSGVCDLFGTGEGADGFFVGELTDGCCLCVHRFLLVPQGGALLRSYYAPWCEKKQPTASDFASPVGKRGVARRETATLLSVEWYFWR